MGRCCASILGNGNLLTGLNAQMSVAVVFDIVGLLARITMASVHTAIPQRQLKAWFAMSHTKMDTRLALMFPP